MLYTFDVKRDIYNQLLDWRSSQRRKPLLLQGARQTGKTYILKEFGQKEYARVHYFNFEKDRSLDQFFERDLNPQRILQELSIYGQQPIKPREDLIIFDEIQASSKALHSLKYFHEQEPDYHLAAAGSLLGVKMSSLGSFPVGQVNFLKIHPMNFFEFLDAMGEGRYRVLLEGIDRLEPLSQPLHDALNDLLRIYYFIGGMPEAVHHYAETKQIMEVRKIHQEIVNSYLLDFAKHAPTSDIPKLSLVWESISAHLSRENKKFMFSLVKEGARAREYEHALVWLEDAGLIHRVNAVEKSQVPLKYYADAHSFKIYFLDVGLLGALVQSPVEMVVDGLKLFDAYQGAFVENYVLQQLAALLNQKLYYWRGKGGVAEVDFLLEVSGRVFPLEVKAGINPKSKSLRSYDTYFNPYRLLRTTLLNLKADGKVCNIPLYAILLLPKLVYV